MNTGHPRDVDPSITGQPHQVTGRDPDLMGKIPRTLGNRVDMLAAVLTLVPPQPVEGPPRRAFPLPWRDRYPSSPRFLSRSALQRLTDGH